MQRVLTGHSAAAAAAGVLALVIAVAVAGVPTGLLPFVIAGLTFVAVLVGSLLRPSVLLHFTIFTSAAAGLFRSFEDLQIGRTQMTVSGFRWVATALLLVLLLALWGRRVTIPWHLAAFLLFAGWMGVRLTLGGADFRGMKDVLFYTLPPLFGIYTATAFSLDPRFRPSSIANALTLTAFIPAILYLVTIGFGGVELTVDGPIGVLGPRPVATYLLIVMSVSLAAWRYQPQPGVRGMAILVTLVALGTVIFTASRVATATALLLLLVAGMDPQRLRRLVPRAAAAAVLVALVFAAAPPLRNRLFHRQPQDLRDAVEVLNLSGRPKMWEATVAHALDRPLIGWGPGSARGVVGRALDWPGGVYPPHNEFLQTFHDGGAIGLVLLLAVWLILMTRYFRKWKLADLEVLTTGAPARDTARWQLAAVLSLAAVLFNSLADNTLHYTFVMAPAFIVLSCADQAWSRSAEAGA